MTGSAITLAPFAAIGLRIPGPATAVCLILLGVAGTGTALAAAAHVPSMSAAIRLREKVGVRFVP